MAYQTIMFTIEDSVAIVTLNRPDALNALNAELWGELVDALEEADRNKRVRAIIITGSDKAFAAGADVTEMAEKEFSDLFLGNYLVSETERFNRIRKPVIAAVAGYALGGGCELAMMCDFIIAADSARFGQPEVNLGITAGLGGTQRLTRFVGKSKAMEMHLTGRFMDATEAERCGLVSRVVPARDLMTEARTAAQKIAEKSQLTVMAIKDSVNRAFETTLAEGVHYERRMFQSLFATEDQAEGMAAFREKRAPQFRDK
ncbi:MAG: enoyl-CoA hydratase [Rubellimicrobium sp.]|nr:enoyl-CoA hydratase [Rubellimicrobium sp.]